MIFPSFNDFNNDFKNRKNQVVYSIFNADLDTAVSLMIKLTKAKKNSFLLESVTGGEIKGRYSIIGMDPDLIWECSGRSCSVLKKNSKSFVKDPSYPNNPLKTLRSILEESKIDLPQSLPKMAAGLFGFLGYDMIRLVENLPNINKDILKLPDAVMIRPQVTVIMDNVKGEIILVCPIWNNKYKSAAQAYDTANTRIKDIVKKINTKILIQQIPESKVALNVRPRSNIIKEKYIEIVKKAKKYILEGEIFQVVTSQRWSMRFDLPPFSLYRALRSTNPSPYMFFFNMGSYQVVGASPEILVRVQNRTVTIRPIAGTRPRGKSLSEDKSFENDLLNDPKEIAEHLMLLDLGRNDTGKVSKVGTVRATEQFLIEKYSHVMHIVSNVEGVLAEDHDALSALLSGLPAGTVSGAPKVRAMQIIDELETEKRGVYGGGIGYFSSNGEMDMCIALRTGIIKRKKLYIQAGGGIVYDSKPEDEFSETVNKSKALLTAAKEAINFVKIKR